MIRKISLLFIVSSFFVITTVFQTVRAQVALDYYGDLLDSWGIRADVLPQDIAEENIVKINTENRYLLLFASQLQDTTQIEDKVFGYLNIIIVCDSLDRIIFLQNAPCPLNNLNIIDQSFDELSIPDSIVKTLRPVKVGNINYYILPQILFVTPKYQKYLSDFFIEVSKSQDQSTPLDNGKINEVAIFNFLENIKNSPIFENSVYVLSLLLLVIIIKSLLTTLVRSPQRFLEQNSYTKQIRRFVSFINSNSAVISFVLLIMALFYVPILYTLYVKARFLDNLEYPVKYISATLNPFNIPDFLFTRNILSLGLLFYHYLFVLLLFFLLVPNLSVVLISSVKKVTKTKLKLHFIKWLILTLIYLNALLLIFFSVASLSLFLIFSLFILASALLYVSNRGIIYVDIVNKNERRLIFGVMLLIVIIKIAYPFYSKNIPVKYTYDSLVEKNYDFTTLPYSKDWDGNVLFKPYYYSGKSNVFVNSYLIFSPDTDQIINKPLKKFSADGSVVIVSGKSNKTVESLLRNPKLFAYTSTPEFSPLFVLDNRISETINTDTFKVWISLKCFLLPVPTTIKLEILNLNNSERKPINTESLRIMNFPGCKKDFGSESFEVPMDSGFLPHESTLLRLRGIDDRYLANIIFTNDGKILPITFINKDVLNVTKYKILYSAAGLSNEIISYSTGVQRELIIGLKSSDRGFDLSQPINNLIKEGSLEDSFIIWSDSENEIIKNDSN